MMQIAATMATPPAAPSMRFVCDEGQVKMEMPHGEASVSCERMRMKVADGCTVQVSAVDGQVEVRCDCMAAQADCVTKAGKGDRIVLEGHVKFEYSKDGQKVEATADRVVYDASSGQFEIKTAGK